MYSKVEIYENDNFVAVHLGFFLAPFRNADFGMSLLKGLKKGEG
jgi:hypothetical protein